MEYFVMEGVTLNTQVLKNRIRCALVSSLLAVIGYLGSPWVFGAAPVSESHHIVTLRPGINPEIIVSEHSLGQKIKVFDHGSRSKPRVFRHVYKKSLRGFTALLSAEAIKKLRSDPRVLAVESDGPIHWASQTVPVGVSRMGVDKFPIARINGIDGPNGSNERVNVDVAVLDTGIDLTHPDLNVYRHVGFADPGLDGNDWNGHGTHVAGIIGALDNDIGVVGVAPGVRLWSVQVLGSTAAYSQWSNLLAGLEYVGEHADEISVVNASLTGTGAVDPLVAIEQAVSSLVDRGIVFVAAAGNNQGDVSGDDFTFGTTDDVVPAGLPEVLAVTAMDPVQNKLWFYTNYSFFPHAPDRSKVFSPGGAVDVTAPGVNILSTNMGGGYVTKSGTSMAAAHVSGLVALYVSANGRAHTADETYAIRQKIIDTGSPQSVWYPSGTWDIDGMPEPLAMPSMSWVPAPADTPKTMGLTPAADGFHYGFTTAPGCQYTVQYRDSYDSGEWHDLSTIIGSGAITDVVDPGSQNLDKRFYRVVMSGGQ